jgi:endonuclease/exonuclease/phosphatase family metal-dependent hydrolase
MENYIKGQTLKLVSWNVLNPAYAQKERYGEATHAWLDWPVRRPALLAELRALDADIYCLQEVTQAIAREIQVALGGAGAYDLLWSPRKTGSDDGCATLWRAAGLELVAYSVATLLDGAHIVQAILLRDPHSGVRVRVCNTHINWETRLRDIPALLAQLDAGFASETPTPMILVGDFNAERSEPWYAALGEAGFRDAWQEATTLHISDTHTFSNGGLVENKWVDFALVHGPLVVESVGLGFAGCDNRALPSERCPSDHLPLIVRFTVTSGR